MDILNLLLLFVVGLAAGAINTLAAGGSLLTLPVLIFLGLPPHVANASNRVAIFLQNIFAVRGFKSKGVSVYPFNLCVAISAFIGAIIGASLAVDINEELFNRILAIVIIAVIIYMGINPLKHFNIQEKTDKKSTIIAVIVFFFIGIYGGFIQAGVGYLMITALTLINGFDMVKTNSIKVFVVLAYTTIALGIFIYHDIVNWAYGIPMAIGNATGAWWASRWSVNKGDKWIRYIVMVTALACAIKLFFF